MSCALVHQLVESWNRRDVEVVEVVDGKDGVVAVLRQAGRGVGSRLEMDETDAHLFTTRDGRIVRWQNFSERADALEAAGLPARTSRS